MENVSVINDILQKKELPLEIRKIIVSHIYSPKELSKLILSHKDNSIDIFNLYKQELCKDILSSYGYLFTSNEWSGRYSYLLSTITDVIETFRKNRNYLIDLSQKRDVLEYIRSYSLLEEHDIPFDVKDFVAKNALIYDKTTEMTFQSNLTNIINKLENDTNEKEIDFKLDIMSVLSNNYINPQIKYQFVKDIIKHTPPQSDSTNYKVQSKLLDTFIIYDGFCIDVRYVIKEAIHQSNAYIVNNYVKINGCLLTYALKECIKQDNLRIFKVLILREMMNGYQSFVDVEQLIDYCVLHNTNLDFLSRLCKFKKFQQRIRKGCF